jgi:hypothetical protein
MPGDFDYELAISCGNTSRFKVKSMKKSDFQIVSSISQNEHIAILKNGFIVANNAGKTTIDTIVKTKDGVERKVTTHVSVRPGGIRVSLKPQTNAIGVGETLRIRTMVSNGVLKSIQYQSTNLNVVSLNADGSYCFVKGISAGTATILICVNVGGSWSEEQVEIAVNPPREDTLPIDCPVDASNYNEDDDWQGSRVFFGAFEQDGNLKNGKEPILWRVLDISDDTILLLSEYGLICRCYHETYEHVTWETSDIRKWLNETFLDVSFTKSEANAIGDTWLKTKGSHLYNNAGGADTRDKVFLLPKSAVVNPRYGFMKSFHKKSQTRMLQITEYALNEGGYRGKNGNTCWWLRSPGITNQYASYVLTEGRVTGAYFSGRRNDAIRPAIRIKRSQIMFGDNISVGTSSYPTIIVKDF